MLNKYLYYFKSVKHQFYFSKYSIEDGAVVQRFNSWRMAKTGQSNSIITLLTLCSMQALWILKTLKSRQNSMA